MIDTVTGEIIRNGLYAVAREMKVAMMRTAGSAIIHSGGDSSAAIFDAKMQLVAQGNDIPTMMGSAVISTKKSVEAIGVENLRPGDVIISNDVYLGGGNHQPDVQFTRPVFFEGKIIAYTMTRGHWVDIGGSSPGSYTPVTWDVHAEGIRIPPVVLYRNDEPVADLMRMVVQNTRDPDDRILDINAQYAGTFVGDRRIVELAKKYGADLLQEAMAAALDYSEQLIRAQIARMPDGVYCGEDYLEPVAVADWPQDLIPLKVKITIDGDRILFDYTGTSPQVRGGVNCPLAVTYNSTWFTVKAVTDPTIPINQGCYRPIEVVCPEGTILNCTYPAPVVSGNTETSPRVIDMLLKTLSAAIPDHVVAQSYDSACAGIFGGLDPVEERVKSLGRRYVTQIDVHGGGFGARPDKDGISAMRVLVGNVASQPVELIELISPVTVEKWELAPDSGGAGKWRGGLASERRYRVEYEEATLTLMGERARVAPQGLFGGKPGQLFHSWLDRSDGSLEDLPPKGGYKVLHKGDRVTVRPAGSGGYGNPIDRDPARVHEDAVNGYITTRSAREEYGVVLAEDLSAIDLAETERLRSAMRQSAKTGASASPVVAENN